MPGYVDGSVEPSTSAANRWSAGSPSSWVSAGAGSTSWNQTTVSVRRNLSASVATPTRMSVMEPTQHVAVGSDNLIVVGEELAAGQACRSPYAVVGMQRPDSRVRVGAVPERGVELARVDLHAGVGIGDRPLEHVAAM